MKLCILSGIFPPDIGGPATYVEKLAQELTKKGIRVKVITYSDDDKKEERDFRVIKVSRKYPKIIRHFIFFIKVLINCRDCDVIYAQNLFSVGIPGLLVSKLLGKRFIVKIVGDYAWEQSLMRGYFKGGIEDFQKASSFRINFLKKIQKILANRAEKIITPSYYLKKIIKEWGILEEKIEVIYNTPDESFDLDITKKEAKNKIGIEGDIILTIGRLVPWKGFSSLIEIMPTLLKENQDFKLIIVGEGPEEKNLKSQISNLKIEDNVKLLGKVNHKEIALYFKAADIFILNSEYEGLSHVILEAMKMGVPVIASNKGGNPELIEDNYNGFLIEYNNKEQIKNAILKLSKNKDLQEKFIRNSKEKLKEFTWENLFERTLKVLKEV